MAQLTETAAPAEVRRAGRRRLAASILVPLAWIVAGTWLQLARQEGLPATDSIWAEDGHLFLTTALNYDHPLELLVAPAGDYMHAVPRMLAITATLVPMDDVAAYLSVASAAIVAALSVFVFFASRHLIRSPVGRAVLAGAMVLLPAAAYETANNTANLHYYLTFACFWALLWVPGSLAGAAVGALVAAAAATSDPLVAILLPLAVWSLVKRRSVRTAVVGVAFAVGLLVQALVVATADQPGRFTGDSSVPLEVQSQLQVRSFAPRTYDQSHPEDLPELYGLRVAGSLLAGDRLLTPAWRSWDGAFAYACLLLAAGLFVYGFWRPDLRRAWVLLTSAYSIAFFAVPVAIRGTEHVAPIGEAVTYAGSRYVIVPVLLLLTVALIILANPDPRVDSRAWRAAQIVLMLGFGAVVLSNFPASNLRSAGPSWSGELARARTECIGRPSAYQRIRVSPPRKEEGFNVLVRCDRILT